MQLIRLKGVLRGKAMKRMGMIAALACAVLLVACSGGAPAPAQLPAAKAPAVTAGVPGVDYDPRVILVTYRNGLSPADIAAASEIAARAQAGAAGSPGAAAAQLPNEILRRNAGYTQLTDAIAQRYGLTIRQQVYISNVNMASFGLPAGAGGAEVVAALPREFAAQVAGAQYDPLHHAHYLPNDPDYTAGAESSQWGHWKVNCGQAWDYTMGDPQVLIAVVDTGVNLVQEELTATVIDPAVEFPGDKLDVKNHDNTVDDTQGHGSIIAGIIAAEGDNGRTIIGVAPHCRVLPVKIADGLDTGTAEIIAGCELAQQLGARVINLSWGTTEHVDIEEQMVFDLTDAGVLLVGSAGNDGAAVVSYPGAYGLALSVGATGNDDKKTTFSNWAETVSIAAPGKALKSCGHGSATTYASGAWGTSFAAPFVAGAAGLLWSYAPQLSLAQVRSALVNSGPLLPDFYLAPTHRLDIYAALQAVIQQLTPSADGITVEPAAQVGTVYGRGWLTVRLVNAANVTQAQYTLDFAPVGVADAYDLQLPGSGVDFAATFILPPERPNQLAEVRVVLSGVGGLTGEPLSGPVTLYNMRGDANGDGLIDAADVAAVAAARGSAAGDADYSLFADTDLDGSVTEADIAAIGYFWLPAS